MPARADRLVSARIAEIGAPDSEAIAHARARTAASGSSFYWAMRLLPADRRDAMFAIYAFCREVDDIADGPDPVPEKRCRLDAWRGDIARIYDGSRPQSLTARALCGPVAAFGLRCEDFLAVIDGMAMDVGEGLQAPSMAVLELYCQRVAGAVGLLSIRAFGAEESRAKDFALALGTALQLTNILRDLGEDAEDGRLYLPCELLAEAGIHTVSPRAVLAHPALPEVCTALARIARERFAEADTARADCRSGPLRPAVVMMMNYKRLLDGLEQRGWRRLDHPVGISRPAKIWLAFRYGLLG